MLMTGFVINVMISCSQSDTMNQKRKVITLGWSLAMIIEILLLVVFAITDLTITAKVLISAQTFNVIILQVVLLLDIANGGK